ncbi:phosphatidylserine decarboxylase [Desulforegula conservatrix]|uniref:phosphatidylserine decarboxylase n=1 Tax=Desulforegula conservatrix TaxID=153026 RepID=UPI0003FD36B0|nr:phosphatidylserine decarboxylase [Desulforegula conservatrix]
MNYHHYYIDRHTGGAVMEKLAADAIVRFLYSPVREKSEKMFRMITSPGYSDFIAKFNYDFPFLGRRQAGQMAKKLGIDLPECLEDPGYFDSARKLFERKIRYCETRPMPENHDSIVSPADSRVITGSLLETEDIFIKDKFFTVGELMGKSIWAERFADGDFAVFRLTPDKYHYNHMPVSGRILDFYEIDGGFHSCNPCAIVSMVTPYSKNRRFVTLIDTDVEAGSGVGIVAMIEVVALMIGDVVQCYSEEGYDSPTPVTSGLYVKKGCPKSLFRPGSSTDILLFEKGRIRFSDDIIANLFRPGVQSRFSIGFRQPLVETDVRVRSEIAVAIK